MAATIMAACRAAELSKDDELGLVAGLIGEGASIEYLTWERALDLPDPKEALENADTIKLPKRGDQVFTMLTTVVQYAKTHLSERYWSAAWVLLGRASDEGHADLATMPARMLGLARTSKLLIPKEVRKFAALFQAAGLLK